MTQFPDLFAAMAAPFDPAEIKSRAQAGRQLHYITARVAMNRLDSVLGPEAWWDDYTPGENSVLCRLTIRLPDGSLLTKADAGGYAGMPDSGDDDKSGYSDSFKRACVKFGVGRYLYRDGVPSFARDRGPAEVPAPAPEKPRGDRDYHSVSPRDGRQLCAWADKEGRRRGVDLVAMLGRWGKPQGWSWKVKEWDAARVASGLSWAVAKLAEIDGRAGAA